MLNVVRIQGGTAGLWRHVQSAGAESPSIADYRAPQAEGGRARPTRHSPKGEAGSRDGVECRCEAGSRPGVLVSLTSKTGIAPL